MLGRGTPIAGLHLPVRIGGDVALLKGVMKELLEEERAPPRPGPRPRLHRRATPTGFEALAATRWPPSRGTRWSTTSGIDRARDARGRRASLAAPQRIIACWAMGLTQHEHARREHPGDREPAAAARHIGRRAPGLCPVRGHSNVQGDRTMGIDEQPTPAFLDAPRRRFGFAPPRAPGSTPSARSRRCAPGARGVFFALGGNFLSATPDTARDRRARCARCR